MKCLICLSDQQNDSNPLIVLLTFGLISMNFIIIWKTSKKIVNRA